MKIPISNQSTNNEIATQMLDVLLDNFKVNNSVNIIIQKDYLELNFLKQNTSKIKSYEANSDFSLISMKLKSEFMSEKILHFSHMLIEGMFDYYLKYGVTYFFVELEIEESGQFKMWMNKGFSQEKMHRYWNTNIDDGWDTQGNFLRREWRGVPQGSGKNR